jgi:ribose transport system permease protein
VRFGALPIALVFSIIVFQIGNDRFLSEMNVINMTQQGIFLMMIAFDQMIVLIPGGWGVTCS